MNVNRRNLLLMLGGSAVAMGVALLLRDRPR